MSFPTVPDVNPVINITVEEVTNLLLASIAFEELGLAHLINAEAEKIQFVLGTLEGTHHCWDTTFNDLILVDNSVKKSLRNIIKQEMLLQFKLEEILENLTLSDSKKNKVIEDKYDSAYNRLSKLDDSFRS